MALTRREVLLGGAAFGALGLVSGNTLLTQVNTDNKNRKGSVKVFVGEIVWNVPVGENGEPFLEWLAEFFQVEFKEGPWENFEGRLLVYLSDKEGNTIVGEDLALVINRSIVPNIGLDYLLAREGDHYEINSVAKLAEKYPFFQLQS